MVIFDAFVCEGAAPAKNKPGAPPWKKQAVVAPDTSGVYLRRGTWQETVLKSRQAVRKVGGKEALALAVWKRVEQDFPVEWDWAMQDGGNDFHRWFFEETVADRERKMIERLLPGEWENSRGGDERQRLDRYVRACEQRRATRLEKLRQRWPKIVFTKHYNLGGWHYAYTEDLSFTDPKWVFFTPGSALCVLDLSDGRGTARTLLEDPDGVIRDPDVSHDGKRILFAWKKNLKTDDYHLYELDIESGRTRQITSGVGVADYEGAYLPNGDIVFNSTRCFQVVDCAGQFVSNLYTCDANGKYLRRLSFDQVHTTYPTVTHDGRVLYTRWDYNDRSNQPIQALFQMNPDGTTQTEFYGNNSWFPTTILHARLIPGSQKAVAILSGHHSLQKGKLAWIDPTRGRQETIGVTMLAPVRPSEASRMDSYGQDGEQFQYPYPLSETQFLVSYDPVGWSHLPRNANFYAYVRPELRHAFRFKLYFMTADGQRELLVADTKTSCNQPVPLIVREPPPPRPSVVDYTKRTGTFYVQDIYAGPGLAGVPRGTIKQLRVVELRFRPESIRRVGNTGPAAGAGYVTPPSVQNANWDIKAVVGHAKVHEDGSVFFTAPARTPLYFQALDENGHMVQTMRSWATLQPGENAACVGCHESKNAAPPPYPPTAALRAGPQPLTPFYGPTRGFSFPKEIQPILDRHCIRCHNDRAQTSFDKGPNAPYCAIDMATLRELRAQLDSGNARFLLPKNSAWDYTVSRPGNGWEQPWFVATGWQRGTGGFGAQANPTGPIRTKVQADELWLRTTCDLPENVTDRELVFLLRHNFDVEVFLNGVLAAKTLGYVLDHARAGHTIGQDQPILVHSNALAGLRPGRNTIAVHCRETGMSVHLRPFDLALLDAGPMSPPVLPPARPFSLLADTVTDNAAGRKWSDAYLALTQSWPLPKNGGYRAYHVNKLTCWVSTHSGPEVQPPYSTGAARSGLIAMLEKGHNGVRLSREELDKFICWIDLAVPFCGDYDEANAWTDEELRTYAATMQKRAEQESLDRKNIEELNHAKQSR